MRLKPHQRKPFGKCRIQAEKDVSITDWVQTSHPTPKAHCYRRRKNKQWVLSPAKNLWRIPISVLAIDETDRSSTQRPKQQTGTKKSWCGGYKMTDPIKSQTHPFATQSLDDSPLYECKEGSRSTTTNAKKKALLHLRYAKPAKQRTPIARWCWHSTLKTQTKIKIAQNKIQQW